MLQVDNLKLYIIDNSYFFPLYTWKKISNVKSVS